MSKKLLAAALLIATGVSAQKKDLIAEYSKYIDTADLRKHLTVLASDEYEGRETGKKGQQLAAAYIQQSFKEDGCSKAPGMSSYEQFFEVVETTPGGELNFGTKSLVFKTDYVYFGAKQQVKFENLEIHTLEDYERFTIENGVLIHPIAGMDIRAELDKLRRIGKNAKAIILVTPNYESLYEYLEHYATSKSMRLKTDKPSTEQPIFVVRAGALDGALKKPFRYLQGSGKKKVKKKATIVNSFSGWINKDEQVLTSSNVLGYIPGSDPILAKEIIVITAHYDHIGIDNGVVFNGADDDGTGTVALLEIAEAFMKARREGNGPRRSILIMTVSGEEKGLLGSSYYVDHPVIPLENTIADLNIDMIGRNDIAHENSNDYIYIIGSNMISTDLHNANEKANQTYTQLLLDYKFNSKNDPNQFYYRSDHYNFAKNGIPSIFYFSGIHEDYHQATDDIEKIIFSKVERVARLVFATAWSLANETNRPRPDY